MQQKISRILIVYGSSRGHTARMAKVLAQKLEAANFSVTLKNVFETQVKEIREYPYLILGCSTYGQGDLQQDFLAFERDMDNVDLEGIQAAIFGSGNRRYVYFAEAVDILEAKVKTQGARLLQPSLKQDMMREKPEGEALQAWANELVDTLLHQK